MENLTCSLLWLKEVPSQVLTSILGILAWFEEDQRKEEFNERFNKSVAMDCELGNIQHAITLYLSGRKMELTFQILQVCVKLASNNLLPNEAADNFVKWISHSELSGCLNQLLDWKIPTVSTFKSQMLISASRLGFSSLVSNLIAWGADINAGMGSYMGDAPITAAISKDRYHIVEMLLNAGADLNTCNLATGSSLYVAIQRNEGVRMVELLIKHGANVNKCHKNHGPILMEAILHQKSILIPLLLKAGADVNATASHTASHYRRCKVALQSAVLMDDIDALRLLIKHDANVNAPEIDFKRCELDGDICRDSHRTPLQIACYYDRPHLVQLLLEAGADINACPWKASAPLTWRAGDYRRSSATTALQAAVLDKNTSLVCYLLRAGANVSDEGCPFTALQNAARCMDLDMVRLLIAHGASLNAPDGDDNGRTALQAAAETGHTDLIRLLLNAGADASVPACSRAGRTALQAAVEGRHLNAANILLEAGADINAPAGSYKGRTCLQAAALTPQSEMVRILLQAGADPNGLPARSSGLTALQKSLVAIIETKASRNLDERFDSGDSWSVDYCFCKGSYEERKWHEFCQIRRDLIDAGANINALPSLDSIISTAGLAIWTQNWFCLHYFIEKGLDLSYCIDFSSVILEAIAWKDIQSLVYLIRHHFDVNMPGRTLSCKGDQITPLALAAEVNDVEMTEILLTTGADLRTPNRARITFNPLGIAAYNGSVRMVKLLLKHGADPIDLYWNKY